MSNWIADKIGSIAGAWTYWTEGGASTEAQGRELDAKLAEMNRKDYESGKLTLSEFQDREANRIRGSVGDVSDQITESAQEGANDGLNDVTALPGKAVGSVFDMQGKTLWGLIKNIPWWVWLLALVALFFYLGGNVIIRKKLVKMFA